MSAGSLTTTRKIFLDCIHFTATQFEIVNKIAQWISRATEPQSPVLLRSIGTLGASVSEINETFLETKLPQYTETISIRSLESFPSMVSCVSQFLDPHFKCSTRIRTSSTEPWALFARSSSKLRTTVAVRKLKKFSIKRSSKRRKVCVG